MKKLTNLLSKTLLAGGIAFSLFMLPSSCELFNVGLGAKVDITAPTVTISSPDPASLFYTSNDITISGSATDDVGVSSVVVRVPSGSQYTQVPATLLADGTWTATINQSLVAEGENLVRVAAIDGRGQEGAASISIVMDRTAPVVYVLSPISYKPQHIVTSTRLTMKGEAADSSRISRVDMDVLNAAGEQLFTTRAEGTTSWTASIVYGTGPGQFDATDGDYWLRLRATDRAGNESSNFYHFQDVNSALNDNVAAEEVTVDLLAQLEQGTGTFPGDWETVQQNRVEDPFYYEKNTRIPTVSIILPVEYGIAGGEAMTASGQATGEGAPVLKVEWAVAAFNEETAPEAPVSDDAWESALLAGAENPIGWTAAVTMKDNPEGLYRLFTRAIDMANNVSELDSQDFYYDNAAPEVGETLIGTTPSYQKDDFSFGGTVYDSHGLRRLVITRDNEADPVYQRESNLLPEVDNEWSYFVAVEANPSDEVVIRTYQITATDLAGRVTVIERRIFIDTTAPVISFADPIPSLEADTSLAAPLNTLSRVNGLVTVKGNANDGSEIKELYVSIGDEDYTEAELQPSNYSFTIIVDTNEFDDLSQLNIYAKAIDAAGNETVEVQSVYIDQSTDIPQIVFTNFEADILTPSGVTTNLLESNAVLLGTVSDDDKVDVSTLKVAINGAAAVDVSLRPSADTAQGSFRHDLNALPEGVHTLQVLVEDINGKATQHPLSGPVYFAIDRALPEIAFNEAGGAVYVKAGTAVPLSGTASDTSGIVPIVEISTGGPVQEIPVAADGTWSFNLDTSAMVGGTVTVTATVEDIYGKRNNATRVVTVDNEEPTVGLSSLTPILNATYTDGTLSGGTVNGIVSLRGTAGDNYLLSSLQYKLGGTANAETGFGYTGITLNPNWTVNIDTRSISDGSHSLFIRAVDAAGNIGLLELPLTVDQSTDLPVVSFNDMDTGVTAEADAKDNLVTGGGKIEGTISDDDGLGTTATLFIDRDGDGNFTDANEELVLSLGGTATLRTFSIDPAAAPAFEQGKMRLAISVQDNETLKKGAPAASNAAMTPIWFAYDTADPSLELTTASSEWHRESFTITGTAQDSYGLDIVEISTDNGSTWTTVLDVAGETESGSQSWSSPVNASLFDGTNDGTYTYQLRASDSFGRTRLKDFIFKVDTQIANPAMPTPTELDYLTTKTPTLQGTASDVAGGSGISAVYLAVAASAPAIPASDRLNSASWTGWNPASGTSNWGVGTNLAEGANSVHFVSVDMAGNVSAVQNKTVNVDSLAPALAITSPANGGIASSAAMTGTASDGREVTSLVLTLDPEPSVGWSADLLGSLSGGTWNWNGTTDGSTALADGSYTATVVASDGGNFTERQVSFTVDTSDPTLSISSIQAIVNPSYTDGVLDGGTLNGIVTVRGTVGDDNRVSSLQYKLGGDPEEATGAGYSPITILTSWSVDVDSRIAGNGSHNLYIRAVDAAGNIGLLTLALTVDESTDLPVVSFNDFDTGVTAEVDAKDNLVTGGGKIEGTISDDDGMGSTATLFIDRNGNGDFADADEEISLTLGGTSTQRTFSIDPAVLGLTQGKMRLAISVQDNAALKKTAPAASNVAMTPIWFAYDTSDPDLDVTTVSGEWHRDSFDIEGTSQDSYGLDIVELSTDGGSTWTSVLDVIGETENTEQTWSSTVSAALFDGTNDGTYTYQLRATDSFGRTRLDSFTFKVDTSINNPAMTSPTDGGWITTSTPTLLGSATDVGSGSGIAAVYMALGATPATPAADRLNSASWVGWNAASGTTSWSVGATLSEGANTVRIISVDMAGNVSAVQTYTVNVDSQAPNLVISSPVNGSISDSAAMGGTATDTRTITALTLTLDPEPSVGWSADLLGSLSGGNWSWNGTTNGTTPLADGSYIATVVATDASTLSTSREVSFTVDTTPPDLAITGLSPIVTPNRVNGTITLTASASDLNGLAVEATKNAVRWWVLPATDPEPVWDTVGYNVFNAAPYTTTINTATLLTDGNSYKVWVGAKDRAANEAYISYSLTVDATPYDSILVDQASDKPVLSLSGINSAGTHLDNNLGTTLVLNGNITDDDGVNKDKIFIGIAADANQDGSPDSAFTFVSVSTKPGTNGTTVSFSDNLGPSGRNLAQGYYVMQLKVGDIHHSGSIADESDTDLNTWTQSSIIRFVVDTQAPSLVISQAQNMYVGNSFTLSGTAADAISGIKDTQVLVNGVPIALSGNTWTTTIDSSTAPEGGNSISVSVTDGAGLINNQTFAYFKDVTDPSVAVSTDFASWRNSGTVAVSGSAADGAAGSGISLVEYSVNSGAWNNFAVVDEGGGDATWSGSIVVPHGTNELRVRSRDKAGNYSPISTRSVLVDIENPVPTVTSPSGSPLINGKSGLDITLTVTDLNGSGVSSVAVNVDENNFTSPDAQSATPTSGTRQNGTWDLSVPAAVFNALSPDQYTIWVQATDAVSRSATTSFTVRLDNEDPDNLAISSHLEDAVVNMLITLSGSAEDESGIATNHLYILNTGVDPLAAIETDWTALDATYGAVASNLASGTSNWTLANIDTRTLDNGDFGTDLGDGKYEVVFRVVSTDTAGNSASFLRTLVIDQESDRPVITLSNINPEGGTTLKSVTTVYGSVTDDDGAPTLFRIRQSTSDSWTTVTPSGSGAWTYTVTGEDGAKNLYFEVTDRATPNRIFDTSETDKPRIYVSEGNYVEAPVAFIIDTQNPTIDSAIYIDDASLFDFAENTLLATNRALGGTRSTFTLKVLAYDANGIDITPVDGSDTAYSHVTISGALPGRTNFTKTGTETIGSLEYDVLETGEITLPGSLNGAYEIAFKIFDNSGIESVASRTVVVDNQAPDVSFNNPANAAKVNGSVTITGAASDPLVSGTSSGITTVEYYLGKDWAEPAAVYAATDGTLVWSVEADPLSDLIDDAWLDDSTGVDLYILPVVIRATDNSGNVGSSAPVEALGVTRPLATTLVSEGLAAIAEPGMIVRLGSSSYSSQQFRVITSVDTGTNTISWGTDAETSLVDAMVLPFSIRIDPDGDKPNAYITWPTQNLVLGGSIRINGWAEDDDGFGSVQMRIQADTNMNGSIDAGDTEIAGWWNAGEGKPVTGANNWNFTINASGEFNPAGDVAMLVQIQVKGVDMFGTHGPWSEPINIYVDKNVPSIENIELDPDSDPDNQNELAYDPNMYISQDMILRGTIKDDSAIRFITFKNGSTTVASLTWNGTSYDKVPALEDWFDMGSGYAGGLLSEIGIRIPIDAPTDTTTLRNYTLTAQDMADTPLTSEMTLLINIDTQAPVSDLDEAASPALVRQSDGWYKVRGTAIDTGSDIERIEVYFTRGSGTERKIYNPAQFNISDLSSNVSIVNDSPALTGIGVRSDEYTLQADALIDNPLIQVGQKILLGTSVRTISAWTPGSGTVEWLESAPTDLTNYTIRLAIQIDNKNIIEAWDSTGTIILNDDEDGYVEYLRQTSGLTYTWYVDINSENIPDGPIDIHYIAWDQAGNANHQTTTDYIIQNNGPTIGAVELGVDLNLSGTFQTEEIETYTYSNSTTDKLAQTTTFKVKEPLMSIEPVVTGGNDDLYVYLYYGEAGASLLGDDDANFTQIDGDSLTGGVQPFLFRESGVTTAIELGEAILMSIGEGDKEFKMHVYDSTTGLVLGETTLNMTRYVTLTIDLEDEVNPVVVISPPTNENPDEESDVYLNDLSNGHIDTSGFSGLAANLDDADPKVSGKISIRGTAYDDQRIESLWMNIESFNFNNASLLTRTVDGLVYTRVATYSGGTWDDEDAFAADGWAVTVTDISLDQTGHRINWRLDWNTEKISGIADADIVVRALSEDKGGRGTASSRPTTTTLVAPALAGRTDLVGSSIRVGVTGSDTLTWITAWDEGIDTATLNDAVLTTETAYRLYNSALATVSADPVSEPDTVRNEPLVQVDVVPYIRSVLRVPTYNTHRTSSGAVSLRRGEAGNIITGFNLGVGGSLNISTVKTGTGGTDYAITTWAMTDYQITDEDREILFTMPADARSGWLRLVVNSVEATNNMNSNLLDWNDESLEGNAASTYWTDDRYIRVWQSNEADFFAGSTNPIFPSMSMDTAGTLYASFSNYSTSMVYHSTIGGTATPVFYTYDPPEETEIVVTGTGASLQVNVAYSANYHGGQEASWEPSTNGAGGLYLYDDSANNVYVGRDNRRVYRFELFYHDRMLQQFKNIRIARANSDSGERIHLAYYDRITNSIKYSNINDGYNTPAYWEQIGGAWRNLTDHEFSWVNIDGNSDDDDTATYNDGASIVLGAGRFEDTPGTPATALPQGDSTGEMAALVLTSTKFPVVVYFDADNSILKLARASNVNPKGNENLWTVQSVFAAGDPNDGTYVDYIAAAIDDDDRLHIVFQNSKSQLIYLKSTNTPTDGNTRYTFTQSEVVADSAMWMDLTMKGTTPYISYLSRINSYDGMNIAYWEADLDLNNDGTPEGGWETMTAPMNYKVTNVKSQIETHPIGTGTNWTAAVGYTPGNEYRAVFYYD